MFIKILSTGGPIDKVYFDQKSEFQVGDPQIMAVLEESNISFTYEVQAVLKKDSLEMTDADRQLLKETVRSESSDRILITHGTDSMVASARALSDIIDKTVVFTGSMAPARFRVTDAIFNVGCAIAAVQLLAPGVYIVMNGRVFNPHRVRKNYESNCFEEIPDE